MAVVGIACLSLSISIGSTAIADPIEDVLHDQQHCTTNPINPTLSDYKLRGSGGIDDCHFYFSFDVCLDYNGAVFAPSCKTYYAPTVSGNTNRVSCMPGVWATTVIVEPPPAGNTVLNYIERHSNPLIVYKDCLPPAQVPDP